MDAPSAEDPIDPTDRPVRRCGDDRGAVGGAEVLPFGVLVFVLGTLLVANAWGVVDARFAAESAAREATRAAVEAPDAGQAASVAEQRGRDAFAAHGRDPASLTVASPVLDGGFARCAPLTVTVETTVPALVLPWIGGYGSGFRVIAHHTERIDPYRDGGPDAGGCPP